MQKHLKERTRRLKFYSAAVDLLRNSTFPAAASIISLANPNHLMYRFYGKTRDDVEFCVQVKQDLRSGRKDFMSVFQRKSPQ